MNRIFRKYHRSIALILVLPLLLTATTGILVTMVREWHLFAGVPTNLLMKVHTGEIFHLGSVYPVLQGLGLVGLIVTGVSMSGVMGKKKKPKNPSQA